MNKRILTLLGCVATIATIVVDQWIKHWALGLTEPSSLLGIQIFPVGNPGIFGGFLSGLDPWIIRIFFTVLFAFLCVGVALLFHFLKQLRIPTLKSGLIIYFTGILGNVLDRMRTGAVTDYLLIPTGHESGMAFNFADIVVLVGFVVILVALFKEANQLWFGGNKRQGFWLEPKFQFHIGMLALFVGAAHFIVIGLYSYVFLKVFVSSAESVAALGSEKIIQDYLFGLFFIEGIALFLTFMASILVSHRLVGPILAFEQFLIRRGSNRDAAQLTLRKTDYFRGILEGIANRASKNPSVD